MLVETPYRAFRFRFVILVLLLAGGFFLNRCAQKMAPPGGPPDKQPPEVVKTYPAANSVGLSHLEYIEIEFSEAINKSSLVNSYWLVPEVKHGVKPKWKGNKKVRFLLKDSLRQNQTYVFTLGTRITDLHNNRLAAPFQLAFSTGSAIDSGEVRGEIFAESREKEIFVYAYRLEDYPSPDSIWSHKARFFTQADEEGQFRLGFLPDGKYRVIALVDRDYDKTYSLGSDLVGLPYRDVELAGAQNRFAGLNLFLIQEDTAAAKLEAVDTVTTRELTLRFDEPIRFNRNIEVVASDSLLGTFVPRGISLDRGDPKTLFLFFDSLPPARKMMLKIRNLQDLAGNPLPDAGLQAEFVSATRPDTLPPALLRVVPTNRSNQVPYNAVVTVELNQPVDTLTFEKTFELLSEKGNPVAGKFDFSDLRKPLFQPHSLLEKNATYKIRLYLGGLRDLWGRSFPDTTVESQFTTLDWADLGEIAGTVSASYPDWRQAVVFARPAEGEALYNTVTPLNQRYEIPFLPAGQYLLHSVVDVNENGRWDKGATHPWQFAEPFQFYPDTVNVRKRWSTEGINFQFHY